MKAINGIEMSVCVMYYYFQEEQNKTRSERERWSTELHLHNWIVMQQHPIIITTTIHGHNKL